jgi:CHAT domain-containing protein
MLGELADARRRRAELLLAPAVQDPATRKQREADLAAYDATIAKLDRELAEQLPAVARIDALAAATLADLRQALPPTAALVDYLHYTFFEYDNGRPAGQKEKRTERYLAFVVTRDKVAWVDLGTAVAVEPAVTAWREAISSGRDIPAAVPAKVRELAWEKVRKALPAGVTALYLCPDAVLCKVPFAALPGDRPGTILLEDFAVAVIPHAPFLLDKLWPQAPQKNPPTGALVVGGVKYDAEPAPHAGDAVVTRGEPLLKPGQKLGWGFLDNTVGEVNGVAGSAARKELEAVRIAGDKATPTAVLAALPKAKYAHFATHGFFADESFRSAFRLDPKDFDRSTRGERVGRAVNSPLVMTGLVFAGANNPKTPGRGILTGEQLIDLDLSGLELAVLSACETGLGDVAGGEGVFGLQRAFHYAGARNVVCSLWKVPDESTAALMALFYTNLWDKNLSPMESLRRAQLHLYRNPKDIPTLAKGFRGKFEVVPGLGGEVEAKAGKDGTAHPLLWAAFTLSGPGR